MPHDYPMCLYEGDYTLLYAAITEMTVRKALHDFGYDQEKFLNEFSPEEPERDRSFPLALEFMQSAFEFVGNKAEFPKEKLDNYLFQDKRCYMRIDLPELDGLSPYEINKYRKGWQTMFREHWWFDLAFKTTNKRTQLVIPLDSDLSFNWDEFRYLFAVLLRWKKEVSEVLGHEGGTLYPLAS